MTIPEFKALLTAFADAPNQIEISKGQLLGNIRDEMIEATLHQEEGELIVEENGQRLPANKWIINRVARIQTLADRILEHVTDEPHYVPQRGSLTDHLEVNPEGSPSTVSNVEEVVCDVLGRESPGFCSVLYLTSDAGEGKTTTINRAARAQARAYKERRSDWLLVPIPLGGRTMLRFDDVVVGALVNKLRFQLLYYDAFLQLVRMGVIVPAFDGFEEMFVEGTGGEAVTSLGTLIQQLRGQGNLLIATRKAFFEYNSLDTQARLIDAIPNYEFTFAKLQICRWSKDEFVAYCVKRKLPNPAGLFETVASALGKESHPLLTRPVLAARLVEIAGDCTDRADLARKLRPETEDFFDTFIDTILQREVREKWIEKSGDPARPLLSNRQHHDLLSRLAEEMWTSRTDSLSREVCDIIAELYCESQRLSIQQSRQVQERLTQHALVVPAQGGSSFAFDHEEFRNYFLGEVVADHAAGRRWPELRRIFRPTRVPPLTLDVAARRLRDSLRPAELEAAAAGDGMGSYTRENCGALVIRMLDGRVDEQHIKQLSFPDGALNPRSLRNVTFTDCYFQATKLAVGDVEHVRFERCEFERIDFVAGARFADVAIVPFGGVRAITLMDRDVTQYDPDAIRRQMVSLGITVSADAEEPVVEEVAQPADDALVAVHKALRAFMRVGFINGNTLRLRLGSHASVFFDDVADALIEAGAMVKIPFRGGGSQERFRLGRPLAEIERALAASHGSFQRFIDSIRR